MFSMPNGARALSLRALAGAAAMVVLCGDSLNVGGCSSPYPDQSDARLSVTTTPPAGTYQPGDTVHLRTTVTNSGQRDIGGVRIATTLDYNLAFVSATCTGLGAAADAGAPPMACGALSMTDRMPIGAVATVDVVATVRSAESASVSNRVTVDVTNGPGYTVDTPIALANAAGGGYRVYTAAGQQLSARVDFTHSNLIFDGPGGRTLPFSAKNAAGTYALPGGAAWREATDLLVGTADLGSGVQPFVAARRFVTSADALEGRSFAILEVETQADGRAVSRVRPAHVVHAMMTLCVDAVASFDVCAPASRRWFPLSNYTGEFGGVDSATFDDVFFRVARAGDALVLLGAGRSHPTADNPRRFQIALLSDGSAKAGSLEGGDSLGRWGTLEVAPAAAALHESLSLAGGMPVTLDGRLSSPAGTPATLLATSLGTGTSAAWLEQDGPLAVLLGQPGTPADGLLQLFAN